MGVSDEQIRKQENTADSAGAGDNRCRHRSDSDDVLFVEFFDEAQGR